MKSKRNLFAALVLVFGGALAWGAGNTNPTLQAVSIKNPLGSGVLNINTTGTVTVPNATGTLATNPMTTLGDMTYGGASGANTRLAGDTSNIAVFLSELSSGGVATAETWRSSTGTGNVVLSASPTLTGTIAGANETLSGIFGVTGVATFTAAPILSSTTASQAVFTDGSKSLVSNPITGSGNVVMSTSPTLVTPVIGAATGTSLSVSGQLTSTVATGTAPLVVSSTTNVANLNSATLNGASGATPSTASTLALRDSNGSAAFAREKDDYTTTVTASQTTVLTAASTKIQFFTGSTAGQIVQLPATNAAGMNGTGEVFRIRNTSTQTIAIKDSASGAVATELADSDCILTELTSGSPGTWNSQCSANGAGGGTVTSVAATVPSLLSIAGSPVTTSGTLAFTYSGTALPTANGGTSVTSAGAAGNRLISDGTNWASQAPKNTAFAYNIGFTDSVGSSNWTVALTQSDGSTNCSATAPCQIGMRSSTATSSATNIRSITGALSLTVTSGTTLGMVSATASPIYIYLIDSDGAGTMKLGVSTNRFPDDQLLRTTIAESFSTSCTQASPMVCTSTGHGLDVSGQNALKFTGTISGMSTDCTAVTCYTLSVAANTFTLRPSIGGAGINKTAGGTQTPTVHVMDGSMVSDGVYANVAIRLIGKVKISEATTGTWASVATVRTPVVVPMSNDIIRSVFLNATCSSSPCAISQIQDSWVEQIVRNSGGNYTVYFNPDVFQGSGVSPFCTCTNHMQAGAGCEIDTYGTWLSVNVSTNQLYSGTTPNIAGVAADGRFTLTCRGFSF